MKANKALRPILIVPDTHCPYHDVRAWNLMMKAAKLLKPHTIVSIGDLADFYAVSSHSKNPLRARQLDEEIKGVTALLDQLDSLGAKERIYIAGNHEDRLTRYLQEKAPELFGVVGIPQLLRLKERGWTYVPYKHDHTIGKVTFTHDINAAGRTAIFKALDIYQDCIVTGHTHRLQYVVEGNASTPHTRVSAAFGWLGDVTKVDYMHRASAQKNWALGFGYGYHDPETNYVYLIPVPIVRYTCLVNGTVIR
jgi:predicted phosphodiesterase